MFCFLRYFVFSITVIAQLKKYLDYQISPKKVRPKKKLLYRKGLFQKKRFFVSSGIVRIL